MIAEIKYRNMSIEVSLLNIWNSEIPKGTLKRFNSIRTEGTPLIYRFLEKLVLGIFSTQTTAS